jgi:hypothetical protein
MTKNRSHLDIQFLFDNYLMFLIFNKIKGIQSLTSLQCLLCYYLYKSIFVLQ